MKDYSTFFKYSEAFIKSIKIKDDNIYIDCKGTKKDIIKSMNKDELNNTIERLKKQYGKIIEHPEFINKRYKYERILIYIYALLCLLLALLSNANISVIVEFIGSITTCILLACNIKTEMSEKKRIKNIGYILNNTEKVEETLSKVIDINKELSPKIAKELENMEKLVESKQIDINSTINAKFVDDLGNKDLQKIVERTKIENGFKHSVEIRQDSCDKNATNNKTKRRVRKLDNSRR